MPKVINKKRLVRYKEGAEMYSICLLYTSREKEEKVKEKRAAKKAEEEKAAKKRPKKSAEGKETGDYTLSVTDNDIKSMTQSLVADSVSISAPDRSSFDIKA